MSRRLWLVAGLSVAALVAHRKLGGSIGRFIENYHTYSMPTAGVYDAITGRVVRPLFTSVARELVAACPSGTALEVGSGPGRLAVEMALASPALKVTGLDIAPEMVEMASRRATEAGVAGRVHFEVGDVGAMPFGDGEFDLVVSTFSLHHWPEPERGLAEIQRVLKPGGVGYIYDLSGWIVDAFREFEAMKLPAASELLHAGEIEWVWRIGPVVLAQRLRWRH